MVFQKSSFPKIDLRKRAYGPRLPDSNKANSTIVEQSLTQRGHLDEVEDRLKLGAHLSGGQQQRLCMPARWPPNPESS